MSDEDWEDMDSVAEDVLEVESHTVEWGLVRVDWCPDCLVSHEYTNVYTYKHNPMDAELLGILWLCDDVLNDMEDDEWEGDDE